jgi:uncharacterized protein YcbK (DUF882 family)
MPTQQPFFKESSHLSKSEEELESPFLDGELFAGMEARSAEKWASRLAGYRPESPFQLAFEVEQETFLQRNEFEEDWYDEEHDEEEEFDEEFESEENTDEREFEAERYDEEFDEDVDWEALAEFFVDEEEGLNAEDFLDELEDEEFKEEVDAFSEYATSLEEAAYAEEAAYPFEGVVYVEEEPFLDEEIFTRLEEFWRLLSPGTILQRVQQLLSEGVFNLSLLARFASGQIWNEDYLALEVLFQRQPRLRPDKLDTVSGLKRLRLLRSLAVKHQRTLKPIRERIIRPIFGNPVNFQVGPVGECQIRDLREEVWKLGPLKGGTNKQGRIWYKKDEPRSPRKQTAIDSIVLHHMAYNIGNEVNLYKKVGAHYIVTADGQIAQLYNDLDFLNASNGFNSRSVAIEFAGNFPDHRYHWWRDRKSKSPIPDRCYLTPSQIRAGRCLLATLKARLPGIKYLYAHRQSSKDRANDPGPDVWFNIGEWALTNLNLTDGLPRTHVGTGQPIPKNWRMSRPVITTMTSTPTPDSPAPAPPAPSSTRSDQAIDVEGAVRYNRDSSRKLGWSFDQIRRFFGFGQMPDERRLVLTVAQWQQSQGLKVDGKIGPNTWARMQAVMGTGRTPVSVVTSEYREEAIDERGYEDEWYDEDLDRELEEEPAMRNFGIDAEEDLDVEEYGGEDDETEAEFLIDEVEELETEEFFDELNEEGYATTYEALLVKEVTFPSEESLPIISGATGKGQDYYDPHNSGNPLLDTSGSQRSKRLSKNFTVGEFAKSGGKRFDRARIDPKLIRCLQTLRDHLGKAVTITSGYRSYQHNEYLWKKCEERKKRGESCTVSKISQHLSGRAADIKVAGMTGLELAKAVIDACGCDISIGVGPNYIHIDVRDKSSFWGYGKNRKRLEKAIEDYHKKRCPPALVPPAPASTRPDQAIDVEEAVRYNRDSSRKLGWSFDQIRRFFGFGQMPDERRLALTVAQWQQSQGLKVDGKIGPNTWKRMQAMMSVPQHPDRAPTSSGSALPQGPFGILTIQSPPEYRFSYSFTQDDALWLARMIVGEAGGDDDMDNRAVIWASFNRFAFFTHAGGLWIKRAGLRGYSTFARHIQSYSTTLQPVLHNSKAAARAIKLSKERPDKFTYVETGGFYPGTKIPKGQLKHHLDKIQRMTWSSMRNETRILIERALRGEIPNPFPSPFKLASEFDNTFTYFKQNNNGRTPKNHDEWRQYTEYFARTKKLTWIGEVPNLNQEKSNAFFLDNRLKDLPADSIRIVPP